MREYMISKLKNIKSEISVEDILFFLTCVLISLNEIPPIMQFPGLGLLGVQALSYPLLVGIVYTLYKQIKYKSVLIMPSVVIKFLMLYIGLALISLVNGLWQYPYYNEILMNPEKATNKLPYLLSLLSSLNIEFNDKYLLIAWIAIRGLKNLGLEVIFTFGCSYMFFCWYYRRFQRAFKIAIIGVFLSSIIVIIYGFIDVFYQAGSGVARHLLITFNPVLHSIDSVFGWWPPLLWKGQVRSIFTEPSRMGNYSAIFLPVLWYLIFKYRGQFKTLIALFFCLCCFTILLFLSQSRTAIIMLVGMSFLLLCFVCFYTGKLYWKSLASILICMGFSFCVALGVINFAFQGGNFYYHFCTIKYYIFGFF